MYRCILTLILFLFLHNPVFCQHPLGLGARWGTVNGLTVKYWTSNINSLDATLSYTIKEYVFLDLNYTWHYRALLDENTLYLYWSHGAFGGKSAARNKDLAKRFNGWYTGASIRAGISVPVGFLDFSVETGGRSTAYPSLYGELFAEGIIRYWF